MSLLLDALKKAAQDKQKSAGNAAPEASPVPAPAEQELTLDLEELPDSPVTETEIAQNDIAPADTVLHIEDKPPSAPAVHEELPTLAADVTPPPAEIRHEAAVVPKPAKPIAPPAAPPKTETIPTPPQPAAAPKPAQPVTPSAASLAAQQAAAKQRDALEMMINKSRQADDQKRNIQRYGLVILSLLLILSGGIYFYASSDPIPPVTELAPEAEPVAIVEDVTPPEPVQQTAPVVQPAPVQHASSNIPKPRRAVAAVTSPVASPRPAAEPLQFSKTTRPDPVESLLGQAYEKFQAADYDGANQLYTQVLQRESDNRDGLLGAAAVAVKQQHFELARQKYRQLLVLDPKDSLARAGLSSVDADARDESQLKFMLREQPNAAHLYFALGSVYTSQTRWAEAQQAYFSAFAADSGNADYAYNLAVSLDRLGQYKAASSYYQKALQLAETRRAGFVATDLQTRIDQIARLPDSVK